LKEVRHVNSVSRDYYRIEKAILFLERNFRERPDLESIARSVNLSEHHFHRLFRRWAGISPKLFLQFLTLDYAKKLLGDSRSLLDVTYESGLSSPGRLHDLFVTLEAVTPGEFKKGGAGLSIVYGLHPTPFGECLLAITERGICGLAFVSGPRSEQVLEDLRSRWPEARFSEDPDLTRTTIARIFKPAAGKPTGPLTLFVKGTNFQVKVWKPCSRFPPALSSPTKTLRATSASPARPRRLGTPSDKIPWRS
jgi:AraC family transcriptional regulator of adaptative response/methylated-DNA-[protein]-cysteine methyltransferase